MSYQLPFTGQEVKRILDARLHSPVQDVVGDNWTSGSPLAVTGGTEYTFQCNGNTRLFSVLPDHITSIWNTSTNIASFSEFDNTPEMVANVQFTFNPTASSSGILTLRVYVNETSPIIMKDYTIPFKGTTEQYTILSTFYAGDFTGFDVKNKGVYFTIESTLDGSLYDPAIEIYRT